MLPRTQQLSKKHCLYVDKFTISQNIFSADSALHAVFNFSRWVGTWLHGFLTSQLSIHAGVMLAGTMSAPGKVGMQHVFVVWEVNTDWWQWEQGNRNTALCKMRQWEILFSFLAFGTMCCCDARYGNVCCHGVLHQLWTQDIKWINEFVGVILFFFSQSI